MIDTDRATAIGRRDHCMVTGQHYVNVHMNNWCLICDTGTCVDCARPVFYVEGSDYHHLEEPERGCFLIGPEDVYLRRPDGSIYGTTYGRTAPRRTITLEVDGQTVHLEAWPERGQWYEVGRADEIGSLWAPMNADGSPPSEDEVAVIAVRWEDA